MPFINRCGGSNLTLQSKTVTPNTSVQTVTPDTGYDGLNQVTVNANARVTHASSNPSGASNTIVLQYKGVDDAIYESYPDTILIALAGLSSSYYPTKGIVSADLSLGSTGTDEAAYTGRAFYLNSTDNSIRVQGFLMSPNLITVTIDSLGANTISLTLPSGLNNENIVWIRDSNMSYSVTLIWNKQTS